MLPRARLRLEPCVFFLPFHWPAFSESLTFQSGTRSRWRPAFPFLSVSTEHVNPYRLWKNCGFQKRQPELCLRRMPHPGGMFIYSGISLKVSRCCPRLPFQTNWRNRGRRSSGHRLLPSFQGAGPERSSLVIEIATSPRTNLGGYANVLATSGAVRDSNTF